MYLTVGESRGTEPRSHRFGGSGIVARGIGGIDLDQLLKDFVRQLPLILLRQQGCSGHHQKHLPLSVPWFRPLYPPLPVPPILYYAVPTACGLVYY